jgi:hypothetical protein
MKPLLAALLIATSVSAAQKAETFTGVITDDMCAGVGHAAMRMGPTDAECTKLCVTSHGAMYVLEAGKNIYVLSDQTTPEQFAGQKVTVTGTLDAKTKTIRVASIAAAR